MDTPYGDLVDVAEAARILGVGRTTTYRLLNEGVLASVKIGRRRLIARGVVEQYVRTLYAPAVSEEVTSPEAAPGRLS